MSSSSVRGRRAALILAIAALALGGAVAAMFLFPTSDPGFADGPVVVLGGGSGDRSARAAQLIEASAEGRTVVLSAEAADEARSVGFECSEEHVLCFVPEPLTTFGEARDVAELVEQRGWDRVTVVTSNFHVTRARWLFERCLDVPVQVVGADLPLGREQRLRLGLREAASWSRSLLVHWGC